MDKNLENACDEKQLRKIFEEKNAEYKDLSFSVESIKLKIANINNKIYVLNNSIIYSKKMDKIMYLTAGAIACFSSIIGLLSSTGFSSSLISFNLISLAVPFICLIESATFRLHVKRILSDLNNELSISKNNLKEEERKLLDKKNEMTDRFYELVDCKTISSEEVINFNTTTVLKKYEKPYIRIKKIN